jgi:thiosulfate/3-mercaptopyruvate sulfurtransferase
MFARAMDRMNISPEDVLYIYATDGCAFVHRAYWTFAFCGYHDPKKVKLVQGSLKEWKEHGGELEYGVLQDGVFRMADLDWEDCSSSSSSLNYKCWKDWSDNDKHSEVVDMDDVLAVVNKKISETMIVDARSAGRFYGRDPEPRPGLRGGHMPGAVNVPFVSLLNPEDVTKFRPMEEVRDLFIQAGVKPLEEDGSVPRKVICSCGSGVTAAALAVGLEECGLRKKEDISIYDGSWIDWGGNDSTPIVID